ncbi:hypothetical protein [Magnetospira thiophila]
MSNKTLLNRRKFLSLALGGVTMAPFSVVVTWGCSRAARKMVTGYHVCDGIQLYAVGQGGDDLVQNHRLATESSGYKGHTNIDGTAYDISLDLIVMDGEDEDTISTVRTLVAHLNSERLHILFVSGMMGNIAFGDLSKHVDAVIQCPVVEQGLNCLSISSRREPNFPTLDAAFSLVAPLLWPGLIAYDFEDMKHVFASHKLYTALPVRIDAPHLNSRLNKQNTGECMPTVSRRGRAEGILSILSGMHDCNALYLIDAAASNIQRLLNIDLRFPHAFIKEQVGWGGSYLFKPTDAASLRSTYTV